VTIPTTALDMARSLASGSVTSVALLESIFAQIDSREKDVRAFISLANRDLLLQSAQLIDKRRARGEEARPFAGIPIAIKDNIAVEGEAMTCGSRILEGYRPPYDATAVARIRDEGMLIVGKTNLDEFGFGSSTENSAYGPTRNPHDLGCVPGGTSGGSAAAVAAGFVPWALGTDTGGSIRQPAALCGAVGVRPTFGRVSRYGLVAYASSMDQIGPITSDVADAAALLSVIMGLDPMDAMSWPDQPARPVGESLRLRLGVPDEYMSSACQPEILSAVDRVVDTAQKAGWKVGRVSLPRTDAALSAYYLIAAVEAASNLARYDGVRYGYRAPDADEWGDMVIRTRSAGFGTEAKRRIILGTFASSAGYSEQYYDKACEVRAMVGDDFRSAFTEFDVLLSPISPTTAWKLGEKVDDPVAMYLSDVYSVPASLAGIPAVVIRAGNDQGGLPIGLQICGPPGSDELVLAAAASLDERSPAVV